jgi:hypothetical protein
MQLTTFDFSPRKKLLLAQDIINKATNSRKQALLYHAESLVEPSYLKAICTARKNSL